MTSTVNTYTVFRVIEKKEERQSTYEFDSNLLVIEKVRALEYHTKRTLADLLADTVVYPDNV